MPRPTITHAPTTGGPQTTPHPPREHDHRLATLLRTHHNLSPDALADTLTDHGYTAPIPVYTWDQLVDYPPTSIVTDQHGNPWATAAVPETTFDTGQPWHLVYQPTPPTVTDLTPPDPRT